MALIEARKGRFGFAINPLFVRTSSMPARTRWRPTTRMDISTMGASVFYRAVDWEFNRTAGGEAQTLAIQPRSAPGSNYLRGEIDTKLDAGRLQRQPSVRRKPDLGRPAGGHQPRFCAFPTAGRCDPRPDIGGFGVGSDLTWNAQAIVQLPLRRSAGYEAFAAAGYRALYWDYKDGGFEWDVTMSGPMLGAGMRF